MTRVLTALAFCLALRGAAAAAAPIDATTLAAFVRWTGAVDRHVPGRSDAAVRVAIDATVEQRATLDTGMTFFLSALRGRRVAASSEPEKALAELARREAGGDANAFLKRAAVLHGDAGIITRLETQDDQPREFRPAPAGTGRSPLFPGGALVLDDDGESRGRTTRDWNWVFARSLLDLLSPRPASDPFVADWYHATTAHMFLTGAYGEATYHLERAIQLLPDDPRILFDLACLSEVDGLPIFQQTLSEDELATLRKRIRPGRTNGPGPGVGTIAALTGIPPIEVANADAERLFRRALQGDPSLSEAHARLARLLTMRGRHADANAEAVAALAGAPEPAVAFYAHLFAGRANRALGRLDIAADHYRQALALFPDAQSALLAGSEIALLRADLAEATAPVRRLADLTATTDRPTAADPWWQYRFGPGRDAEGLLDRLWIALTSER